MLLKYKYKLKPDKKQGVIIANWLEMARKQYNYRLAEKLNWFEATRTERKCLSSKCFSSACRTDLSKYP